MNATVRARFWIETGLAVLSGSLCVLTFAWRDWLETLFGIDPDHHNGTLEWAIVAALLAAFVACGKLARAERRRAAPEPAA